MAEQLVKIVVTGAESTGKSYLSEALANHFKCPWVPEFARGYVENLGRHYRYSDVEIIAREQISMEKKFVNGLVIFDTWLIITKVWFSFVYGKHPDWLHRQISESKIDLFLLCDINLPWIPDSVRENGGENRALLNALYRNEIEKYGFKYEIVKGDGLERIKNGVDHVQNYREHKF